MGPRDTEPGTDLIDDSTPEDVAALYRWANLTGAKYRDYSAERREQRARIRHRFAKQQVEPPNTGGGERLEEGRLAESAALRAMEEEREIAEARESARRKQQAFDEADRLRRERTEPRHGERAELAKRAVVAVRAPERESKERESNLISQTPIPLIMPEIVKRAAAEAPATIRPAWLEQAAGLAQTDEANAVTGLPEPQAAPAGATRRSSVATLLDSREQVALRWPALQALAAELRLSVATRRMSQRRGPVVAIVAPAGGAGATSMAAMLACALAKGGERVLLVETAAQGLLSFYFGSGKLEPGELRTVIRHEGQSGAVCILALDMGGPHARDATEMQTRRMQEAAVELLLSKAEGYDRIVIDTAPGVEWIVNRLAVLRPMVLAPVAPEMSSVGGLRAMEQVFGAITDSEGRALLPYYVLNRFDAGLPLHLDIREVLRRELEERLLTVAVRRSAAVGEALAQGATVIEYAPDSPVARDYAEVARWLKEAAPASAEAIANAARGER